MARGDNQLLLVGGGLVAGYFLAKRGTLGASAKRFVDDLFGGGGGLASGGGNAGGAAQTPATPVAGRVYRDPRYKHLYQFGQDSKWHWVPTDRLPLALQTLGNPADMPGDPDAWLVKYGLGDQWGGY